MSDDKDLETANLEVDESEDALLTAFNESLVELAKTKMDREALVARHRREMNIIDGQIVRKTKEVRLPELHYDGGKWHPRKVIVMVDGGLFHCEFRNDGQLESIYRDQHADHLVVSDCTIIQIKEAAKNLKSLEESNEERQVPF